MNLPRVAARLLLGCLVLAGCQQSDDDSDRIDTTALIVGTQYDNVAIEAWGTNFYRFTAAGAGPHTVALTNLTSDMSWMLFQRASWSDPGILQECDNNWNAMDETASTLPLASGTVYYLAIDEWDRVAGTFSLLITFP